MKCDLGSAPLAAGIIELDKSNLIASLREAAIHETEER